MFKLLSLLLSLSVSSSLWLSPWLLRPSCLSTLNEGNMCLSFSGSQQLLNCTVKRQEEVVIQVLKINDLKLVNITVYNHTACGCDCIKRQSECDAKIHDFEQDHCKCKCKQDNSSSCDSTKMSWKEKTCKCECNSAPKICDKSPNQEWNADICECDCKRKVKVRCARKGKALNKKTCECDCPTPQPSCPPGESFLKYNCTCVPNSVVTK